MISVLIHNSYNSSEELVEYHFQVTNHFLDSHINFVNINLPPDFKCIISNKGLYN